MDYPCRSGDFVDCCFPFAEKPDLPGPIRHIAYVYRLAKLPTDELRLMVLFTTASPRMIAAIPDGLSVTVPAANSLRMGMRSAFVVDVHRMAVLPPEREWFPDISNDRFIIGRADSQLKLAVTTRVHEMRSRYPNPLQLVGPAPRRRQP
jgi:hypothetical protein